MVIKDKDTKNLVVPASLGNFGNAGGGEGGITPEEAAEIASAITENALDEYDTELQVDLEDMREAISANTQSIEDLSGATGDISAISAQTSANTAAIQELSGQTGDYVVVDQLSDISDPYEGMMAYSKYKTLNGWAIDGSSISEGYVALVHYDGTAGNQTEIYRSGTDFYWNWDNSQTGWTQDQNIWYKIDSENAIFYAACEDPNAYIELSAGVTTASTSTQIDVNKLFMYDGTEWNEFGGGGERIFNIYDTQANNAELANFLFQYWDENGSGQLSSGYPKESTHIYLWLGQDFQGAFTSAGYGFVELQPQVFMDDEGPIVILTGVFGDDHMNGYIYRQGYRQNGDAYACYVRMIGDNIPRILSVSFGNDDIGGLSYDGSTGLFTLGGNTYASGDTTTPVQDVYDYNLVVNGLLTRSGRYVDGDNSEIICINVHTFTITRNGVERTVSSPSIQMESITPYTVDDIEFNRKLIFEYPTFLLTMDVAESNVGINLRVQ